jgi:hypothetical protein
MFRGEKKFRFLGRPNQQGKRQDCSEHAAYCRWMIGKVLSLREA